MYLFPFSKESSCSFVIFEILLRSLTWDSNSGLTLNFGGGEIKSSTFSNWSVNLFILSNVYWWWVFIFLLNSSEISSKKISCSYFRLCNNWASLSYRSWRLPCFTSLSFYWILPIVFSSSLKNYALDSSISLIFFLCFSSSLDSLLESSWVYFNTWSSRLSLKKVNFSWTMSFKV